MCECTQLCALNVCCTMSSYECGQLCARNVCLNINLHVFYSRSVHLDAICSNTPSPSGAHFGIRNQGKFQYSRNSLIQHPWGCTVAGLLNISEWQKVYKFYSQPALTEFAPVSYFHFTKKRCSCLNYNRPSHGISFGMHCDVALIQHLAQLC